MDNENIEVNVLDELNKGASMGKDAIHFILNKVEDDSLKKELERQYREYEEITEEIAKLYPEYAEKKNDEPQDTNLMNKAMTWFNVNMGTLMDNSTSKIAELVVEGTNMGIIEGKKLLNHKDTDESINKLVENYIAMQEKAIEVLKDFL